MKKACVIGWPISHSRSPLIHGHWLQKHGIDGAYEKVPVKPEDLEAFIAGLAANGYAGCNVTVPHKEAAYALVAKHGGMLHGNAVAVNAANTLWVGGDGRLHATATDAHGFAEHLAASVPGFSIKGGVAVVLGAGGAAQSAIWALQAAGVAEVRVCNRSRERAEATAQHRKQAHVVPWEERSAALSGCDLLVNTTTLGMTGQPPLDIDLSALPAHAVVYDIVYVPLETPLLAAARARGLRTVDGLGMLLHQAVPGFQKWFGVKPEVTAELRTIIVRDIEGP
jgi:shikimate dehydrogenase